MAGEISFSFEWIVSGDHPPAHGDRAEPVDIGELIRESLGSANINSLTIDKIERDLRIKGQDGALNRVSFRADSVDAIEALKLVASALRDRPEAWDATVTILHDDGSTTLQIADVAKNRKTFRGLRRAIKRQSRR